MERNKMKISSGVAALLANAHEPEPSEKRYFFEGDLCQMAKAAEVARQLGIQVGIAGGLPYVKSEEEQRLVIQYIVSNRLEGYWHYMKKGF